MSDSGSIALSGVIFAFSSTCHRKETCTECATCTLGRGVVYLMYSQTVWARDIVCWDGAKENRKREWESENRSLSAKENNQTLKCPGVWSPLQFKAKEYHQLQVRVWICLGMTTVYLNASTCWFGYSHTARFQSEAPSTHAEKMNTRARQNFYWQWPSAVEDMVNYWSPYFTWVLKSHSRQQLS